MSAFDDNRVGLWCNTFRPERLSAIAQFADGMFTDMFLPRKTTAEQMQTVRGVFRPDGSRMKPQLFEIASGSAYDFAQQVSDDIGHLEPGVCELDLEGADDTLAQYIRSTMNAIRNNVIVRDQKGNPVLLPDGTVQRGRKTFKLRLNISTYKARYLPFDLLATDPNLYVAEQCYYGDMSRISESEALEDVLDYAAKAGVNTETIRAKFHPCYGAAGPVKLDGTRGITLPTVYYKGHVARRLRRGLVFTDDLLAEQGLL